MSPSPQSMYLDRSGEPVFVSLHRPPPGTARDTAVMLCPPFGWDEVCSYRSLRTWAELLAQAGYPALRLSLPSTGDSGGDVRTRGRIEAWAQAIDAGARWLPAETGAPRVAAIGIGLGGIVALLGTSRGAPIEELVLWGTQARGRSFLRQLRAFSRLEAARFFEGLEEPPPLSPGELEAGGFLLSAETVDGLEQLDLATVEFPPGRPQRALLLERDGLSVDDRLREHLAASGAEIAAAAGPGYGAMISHPQQTRPPFESIARVNAWLDSRSAPAQSTPRPDRRTPGAVSSAEMKLADGETVRETPLAIPQRFGSLSGVLVEPLQRPHHALTVVLLNAGAVRRIGPNRLWVECARRWATRGVTTLRLDVEGIGDADGEVTPYAQDTALYVPELVPQVLSAVDFLHARGQGERFVLGGVCAGAYWAFQGAARDPRVCGALLVNPRALIWDAGLGPARDLRALFTEPFSLSRIRRVATGPRLRLFLRWLLAGPGRRLRRIGTGESAGAAVERDLDAIFDQLSVTGKRILMLFSAHEPLDDELVRSGRAAKLAAGGNLTVERVAVRDHTMRPVWAQQQAHAALDRAIERELSLSAAAHSRPGSPLEPVSPSPTV